MQYVFDRKRQAAASPAAKNRPISSTSVTHGTTRSDSAKNTVLRMRMAEVLSTSQTCHMARTISTRSVGPDDGCREFGQTVIRRFAVRPARHRASNELAMAYNCLPAARMLPDTNL